VEPAGSRALRRTGFAGAEWFRGQTATKHYSAKRCPAKHHREAGCGSCLRRHRISCREPERQSGPPDWSSRRRHWRPAFGRDSGLNSDARDSESSLRRPRPFAGRACIAWWRGRKVLGLRLVFQPGAGFARSKCPLPATEKWRRKRPWTELVEPARSQPPAEAKAISGHSVSRSPPAVLAVFDERESPYGQNSPPALLPIGHGSNYEGHGPAWQGGKRGTVTAGIGETAGDGLGYTT
jgi:hypothetical protein